MLKLKKVKQMVEMIDATCPKCNEYRSIAESKLEQFMKEGCLICTPHKFHKGDHNIGCEECFPKGKCDDKKCEKCYPKKGKPDEEMIEE